MEGEGLGRIWGEKGGCWITYSCILGGNGGEKGKMRFCGDVRAKCVDRLRLRAVSREGWITYSCMEDHLFLHKTGGRFLVLSS